MKIIAITNNTIGAGGGFDQALNAISQMKKICANRFDFEVLTTQKSNLDLLKKLNIHAELLKITLIDRVLVRISQNRFWHIIQRKFKFVGPSEKKLIQRKCDLVYFITPNELASALQKINYITTVLDLCHREFPEFPEARNYSEFFFREAYYQQSISSAIATLTDSNKLSKLLSESYGISDKRLIAMPFSASPLIKESNLVDEKKTLEKHQINDEYFFYPAQFWSHKNHIRILQALKLLRDEYHWAPTMVFSGRDAGNLHHIKKIISLYELDTQVKILGFIPHEDMYALYKNSTAVVMPTYFGPTNIPPLEAWSIGVPLIYSSHLGDQTGNAALLIDPDKSTELAKAMLHVTNESVKQELISRGKERLKAIEDERCESEKKLLIVLESFSARRECWQGSE